MKAESYILNNQSVLNLAMTRCKSLELDGRTKLTLSDAGGKSARQRGLQFLWYGEVAEAGIGGKHEDTKNGVHLVSKYRWAIPIFSRDDVHFNDLYIAWVDIYGKDAEKLSWFIDCQVHTEKFNTAQAAEFLTEFQRYYVGKGVNLTDPDDRGLLSYEGMV